MAITYRNGKLVSTSETSADTGAPKDISQPSSSLTYKDGKLMAIKPKAEPTPQAAPTNAPETKTPYYGSVGNKIAEGVAGAEMGAAIKNLPLVGKLAYPAVQAAAGAIDKAQSLPDSSMNHLGEIAHAATSAMFNPKYTATNAVSSVLGNNQIDDRNMGAADNASTIGGMLLGANAGPGMIAKAVRQAPMAAAGTAAMGLAQSFLSKMIDDYGPNSKQAREAMKAVSDTAGVGAAGAGAHWLGKGLGESFNRPVDATTKLLRGGNAVPSSMDAAKAEEVGNALGNKEGQALMGGQDEINADLTDKTADQAFNDSMGVPEVAPVEPNARQKFLHEAATSAKQALSRGEEAASAGYNKIKDIIGNDLIKIPQERIEANRRMTKIDENLDDDIANSQGDKYNDLMSLKQVYDVSKKLFFNPMLSPTKKGDDVHFNHEQYDKYLQQANALDNSINPKNVPPSVLKQMKDLKTLVKDSYKQHLNDKEFSGTPEEQERYKGTSELYPAAERLFGQTQKFKNVSPVLDDYLSIKTQGKNTDTARQTEELLGAGYPAAGLEHVTRALQDISQHLPEHAKPAQQNVADTQNLFKKSLGVAAGNNKEYDFMNNFINERINQDNPNIKAPHFVDTGDVVSAGHLPNETNFLEKGKFQTPEFINNITSNNPKKAMTFLKTLENDKDFPGAKEKVWPMVAKGIDEKVGGMFRSGTEKNTEDVPTMQKNIKDMAEMYNNLKEHNRTDILSSDATAKLDKAAKLHSIFTTAKGDPAFKERLDAELDKMGDQKGQNAATRMGRMIDNLSTVSDKIQSRAKALGKEDDFNRGVKVQMSSAWTKKAWNFIKNASHKDTTGARQEQLGEIKNAIQHPEGRKGLTDTYKNAEKVNQRRAQFSQDTLRNLLQAGATGSAVKNYSPTSGQNFQPTPQELMEMKRRQNSLDDEFAPYKRAFGN